MEIYGKVIKDIEMIIGRLCQKKGIKIIEAELCPDHIHMYASISPKIRIEHFCIEFFYVSTVGNNKTAVYRYV